MSEKKGAKSQSNSVSMAETAVSFESQVPGQGRFAPAVPASKLKDIGDGFARLPSEVGVNIPGLGTVRQR